MPGFLQNRCSDVLSSHEAEQRRTTYRALCEAEHSIPLFSRAFWLDAVCGEQGWDVAIAMHGERIDATLPYYAQPLDHVCVIRMPSLTQTAGPWLRPSSARLAKRLAQEKELMTELMDRLESQCKFGRFTQNFHHSITNWLPFYWRGYTQTTRYTYVLDDLSNLDAVWENLQANIRTHIRKAEGRNGLHVRVSEDLGDLHRVNKLTFERQGLAVPYTETFVERLDQACRKRQCRRILVATDAAGKDHAADYLVWDDSTVYRLTSGADPDLRNSGAQALLSWEAIRFAASLGKSFDFDGSMLESVEIFVRSFGTRQVPFFNISKTSSLLLETRASVGRVVDLAKRRVPRRRARE